MDQTTQSNDDSFAENLSSTSHRHPPHSECPPLGSISNLCSATLGAGALSLPYAFSLTGLIPGVILLLLSGYLTILSIDVIIASCVNTKLYKYEDVAMRLVGRSAGRILEASLLIFCFGTAVAYIVAVGDILDMGFRSMVHATSEADKSGWLAMYSREKIMILFWLCIMLPLSLQRHMERLEKFSSLGVLSIIVLVISATIHSISHGEIFASEKHDTEQESVHAVDFCSMLWPNSFWDVVQAFPIIIFAFSCQVNVCAIFEELNTCTDTKEKTMKRITRSGITLCISLYLAIGCFGYLDFAHGTLDNVLNNYNIPLTHDKLMTAATTFVAVAIVVAFPFNILPARVTLKLIWDRLRAKQCELRYGILARFLGRHRARSRSCGSSIDGTDDSQLDGGGALNEPSDGGLEPLLSEDTVEHSVHIPPLSLSNSTVQNNLPASDSSTSPMEHFMLTLFLSGSALIVALLVPGISVLFGLMGGTSASVISFILPGMFLQCMTANIATDQDATMSKKTRRLKLLARGFVWGGIIIGILSTGVTLYGLI